MFAVLSLLLAVSASAFSVKEFTPQGRVKSPRQIRVVFSEPMVAFGDPRGAEPFSVACLGEGKGLWEDSRTWIYEFDGELSAGDSCKVTGKRELKSEKGGTWEGKSEFTFNTGGPAVKRSDPYDGARIDQKPAFLLTLDGAADPASVEKFAYLLVEGLPERIPLKVLSAKVRDEIAKRSGEYSYFEEGGEDGEIPVDSRKKTPFTIALESSRNLPADSRVQLVWGKGIKSERGAATTEDQLLAFHTERDFEATFHCERENENSPCLPIGEMSVYFNASVSRAAISASVLKAGKFSLKPENKSKDDTVRQLRFTGPFPPNTKFTLELPAGLKDEDGRPLSNGKKFPLSISTGDYPPLAKFAAAFGILEAKEPLLPVSLRSVEEKLSGFKLEGKSVSVGPQDPAALMRWVFRLRYKHDNYYRWDGEKQIDTRGDSILGAAKGAKSFDLPKPGGAKTFEVVGIPMPSKGFHVVEIGSRILGESLLGRPATMYVASGALVTNLAVHFKWGAESSLAWVTSLDTGKPVKGARVKAADCTGKILWEGKTDSDGTVLADGFPNSEKVAQCPSEKGGEFTNGLAVLAEKDGDFTFVHTGWDNGIESWRFHLPTSGPASEEMAHTVMDRTLLRAGQTAHMKHFLRERFLRGIRFSQGSLPKTMVLLHTTGRKIVMPVKFNAEGEAESEWKIPKDADLGGYAIYLSSQSETEAKGKNGQEDAFRTWGEGVYHSGSFRVEEFRLPVMAGSIQWPKGTLVGAREVAVDLSVRFLSGGGASGLPVKLRSRVERLEGTSFPDFEGFHFANGGVKVGRSSRASGRGSASENKEKALPDQKFTLDQSGGARVAVKGIPAWDQPTRIALEAEYRDPNGEVQAVSRSSVSYPSNALVGIQPDGWVSSKDNVKFKVAVVSPDGKALKGRSVKVSWFEKETFSHRKRIVGGFYAYENFEEIREKGLACKGVSDEKGLLSCEGKSPGTGSMILVAEAEENGHKARAHHELYIAGEDQWWFSQDNDDRIDFLPERKSYEPGENAKFQVRSPFRTATALVTVEREGVIERFVKEVEGSNPVIEVPIRESYAPNVFVSAFLVRGRVGEPQATALIDLARPSHKLGLAQVQVGWKAHRLKVSVEADKAEYKVREKAQVKVHVDRAVDGKPASKGSVLLLAIDEALLELLPNGTWDLLESMMGQRSLKVQTSTAQSQVIGKRHFGLKALPPGGGGGQSSARELFDTLLFWKATLKLDSNGNATAEVPMNDSLSSFRIVAVASEQADRFGTGFHTVRTRQDLMLFSGVAPLARNGDKINPEVTVRNSGNQQVKAEVRAKVNGEKLTSQNVELSPGTSKTLSWVQAVPLKATQLVFEFEASGGDARDSLKVTQKVEPALRESQLQGTLERVEGKLTMSVAQPQGSLQGNGGVTVKLESSLAANLDAVRRYMGEYPFGCLEQQTSRAVALRDSSRWKAITGSLPAYIDGAGLLKYFPEALSGSDVLTSYVLSISQEAGYSLPENELKRLIAGLQGFVKGTSYYAGFVYPAADLSIRKLSAMEALSRYQSFEPAMLSLVQLEPELWPMRALLDWISLLRREQNIPNREKLLAHAQQILKSKIEWRGTLVSFKGGAKLWWLMNSMDEDANRLLLAASTDASWNADVGRLVRGSLARQSQGHWDLTTANAWGVLAMERFSENHEKEAVSGTTDGVLGGSSVSAKWKGGKSSTPMSFPWPAAKADLTVTHKGSGKPWALVEARAAVRLAEPIFKGYSLKRTVTPVEQKVKGKWSAGDVYRVTLKIEAPSDMTWVAVSDPIPAGATVLGSGLGNDSASLTKGEKKKGFGWGSFEERSFSGFKAYYEWLPRGSHQLEYTVRLNAAGEFQLPNSRVEAMYAPEMYAEVPNEIMAVLK